MLNRKTLLTLTAALTLSAAPATAQLFGIGDYNRNRSGGIALDEGKKTPVPRVAPRPVGKRPVQRVTLSRRPPATPRTVTPTVTKPRTPSKGRMSLGATYRRSQDDRNFAAQGQAILRAGKQARAELDRIRAAHNKSRNAQRRTYLRGLYERKKAGLRQLQSRYNSWKAADKKTNVTYHGTTVDQERRVLNGLRRTGGRVGNNLSVRRAPSGRVQVRSSSGRPNYSPSRDVTRRIYRKPVRRTYRKPVRRTYRRPTRR